jgi:hypothetical protein
VGQLSHIKEREIQPGQSIACGEPNGQEMRNTMRGPYDTRSLTLDQIPQAFPLISLTVPDLSFERWSDYATSFFGPSGPAMPGEIVTVQNADRYIYGLAICQPKSDLYHGRILDVENFVTLDLTGGRRAASVLLKAAEDRARAWDCGCVCVSLLGSDAADSRTCGHSAMLLFHTCGYVGDAKRLAKNLKLG